MVREKLSLMQIKHWPPFVEMRSLNGPKGQRSNIFRKGGITQDISTLFPMGNIDVKRSFNLNKRKGLSLARKISKTTYLSIIRLCSEHLLILMFL
jgi:hypothetical protein